MTSQNPYLEVVRAADTSAKEGTAGGNVEVAIYGWGLQPVYTSGRSAWPITDDLFARLYASRQPFWAEVEAAGSRHRVYFSNDRYQIFAIGYPVLTVFDHFVHLAELTTFGGAVFGVVLIGTGLFTRIARQRPRVGRTLLREIRASFYRKLFLAFVLAAIIPVLTLAVVIRTYLCEPAPGRRRGRSGEDRRGRATRYPAISPRPAPERRADGDTQRRLDGVDQPGHRSGCQRVQGRGARGHVRARPLCLRRAPDAEAQTISTARSSCSAFRALSGRMRSAHSATCSLPRPCGPQVSDVLLTVPLTLRQREIEREIDELDRGIHLAALFFILLGAAIGLSMAERIADPVRRLTRATGKIARGDFDARIAVKSTDEFRRLVDAFNSMAAELKAQRVQLERTHRLEAWAEMARQVAHEIKNPLTPIQLSAEHLQRVHADRGEPLGPSSRIALRRFWAR